MTAWIIVTAKISDRDKFISAYGAAAVRRVSRLGGRCIFRAADAEVFEGLGLDGESVVVSEWPDKASALAFGNSKDTNPGQGQGLI